MLALVGLLALLLTGYITSTKFFDARNAASEVAQKLQPAADSAADLIVAITDMDRGVTRYTISGKSVDLAPFAEGATQSGDDLDDLDQALEAGEPELEPLVQRVVAARQTWLAVAAEPTIAAVRKGSLSEGQALINSDSSKQSFALLQADAEELQAAIDDRRTEEFDALTSFAGQLAVALFVTALVLLFGLAASVAFINVWVIRPLDRLRRQLQEVARQGMHESPIVASGPPELADAARDAEEMRRQLVGEIDEARMAREGLEQEGPVVAAIRAELTRPSVAHAPHLDIFGDLQPAEGVLAGDWWDVIALPDGRSAIVVTDVSGHGPQAGIAGLRAKLILTSVLESGGSAVDAISRGVKLFADTPARFATCVIVVIDPFRREIEWVNAGHLAPLVLRPDGSVSELELTGPLMSALGGTWTAKTTGLELGDVLLLWTDGLSESHDASGQDLEEQGLLEVFTSAVAICGPNPRELVPSVLATSRLRSVDWRRDDVTLIAARFID